VGAGDNRQHLANPLTDRRSDRTSHEARADLTDEFIICTAVVVDAIRKIFADVDLAIRVRYGGRIADIPARRFGIDLDRTAAGAVFGNQRLSFCALLGADHGGSSVSAFACVIKETRDRPR
jgi:hypothetical protein